jgi:hypothetical protein
VKAAIEHMDDEAAWARGLAAHPAPYVGIRDPGITELAEFAAHIRIEIERLEAMKDG